MRRLALLAACLALAGCAATAAAPRPMAVAEFTSLQHAMRDDAAFRTRFVDQCVADGRIGSAAFTRHMAPLLEVPAPDVPAIFCERYAAGIRQGRLSYADYVESRKDKPSRASVLRFIGVLRDRSLGQTL